MEVFKHESLGCRGLWQVKKKGIDGNVWEFQCDGCKKGAVIMNSTSLDREDNWIFEGLIKNA